MKDHIGDTNKMVSDKPTGEAALAAAQCSADQRGYAKGYAAATKRIRSLEAEIASLRELKTPLPPLPLPDSHDVTIEYLVTSAETLIGAANMLIKMRQENPPNDGAMPRAVNNPKI